MREQRLIESGVSPGEAHRQARCELGNPTLLTEQALDSSAVDIRGDLYSLGVTFYFMLTGKSPYRDGSVSQKLVWHQISAPIPGTLSSRSRSGGFERLRISSSRATRRGDCERFGRSSRPGRHPRRTIPPRTSLPCLEH